MKIVRWGTLVIVAAALFASSGCSSLPWRIISRDEYAHLRSMERLNSDQAALISQMTNEKERLQTQLEAAMSQLESARGDVVDKQRLLEMQRDKLEQEMQRIAELEGQVAQLQEELDAQRGRVPFGEGIPSGVETIQTELGAGLRIPNTLLFDPGKAELKGESEQTLKGIASMDIIQNPKYDLMICGFTDSDPIKHSSWADNWQLSAERARAVLKGLEKQGIDPSRLSFRGFGEHMLVKEDGVENKEKSRRVEIYLIPQSRQITEAEELTGDAVPK